MARRPRCVAWAGCAAWLVSAAGCGDAAPPAGSALRVLTVHGEPGRFPGQYAYPRGIDAHATALVIVDKSARVQRIDPQTGDFLGGWTMPEHDLGKPTGLTVAVHPSNAARSALWVADTHYHRIMVYELPDDPLAVTGRDVAPPPEPLLSFGAYGSGDGQFVYPTDVAVLAGHDPAAPVERVYVSEYGGNDRVSIWEPEHDPETGTRGALRFVRAFGAHGSGPGPVFHRPQSLAIAADRREILVVDSGNHRVGRFTLDGELLAWIQGPTADDAPPLHYPYALCLLDDGTALVCEYGGCRVRLLDPWADDPSRAWLGSYGRSGRDDGELFNPWGVAMIGRTAFVLDSGNARVQAFRAPAAGAGRAALARGVRP